MSSFDLRVGSERCPFRHLFTSFLASFSVSGIHPNPYQFWVPCPLVPFCLCWALLPPFFLPRPYIRVGILFRGALTLPWHMVLFLFLVFLRFFPLAMLFTSFLFRRRSILDGSILGAGSYHTFSSSSEEPFSPRPFSSLSCKPYGITSFLFRWSLADYLFARLRHLCFPVLLHFRHLVFFAFFAFAIVVLPPSFRFFGYHFFAFSALVALNSISQSQCPPALVATACMRAISVELTPIPRRTFVDRDLSIPPLHLQRISLVFGVRWKLHPSGPLSFLRYLVIRAPLTFTGFLNITIACHPLLLDFA